MTARIDHLVTSGTFSLDGQTFEVDNNVWLLGDDTECVVIDAPHAAAPILAAIGDRRLVGIWCTHGHDDHVTVAPELREKTGAPILINPADHELWAMTFPDVEPDGALLDGMVLTVAGVDVQVLATPGHAPGCVCLAVPSLGIVFSGDTLFNGGPGATGRSFSSFPTILESIRTQLFPLGDETRVLTGHGDPTTIGAERPHYDEWVARGH